MDFHLHPQLAQDTTMIGHFPLCLVLLHRDTVAPWIILVPKRLEMKELHHLPMGDQQQFLIESQAVNQALEAIFQPDKINLGALGNLVPQLHIHHIARFSNDMAWPGPIWGNTKGVFRSEEEQERMQMKVSSLLSLSNIFTPA